MNKRYAGLMIIALFMLNQKSFTAQSEPNKAELQRKKQALEKTYGSLMLGLAGLLAVGAGVGTYESYSIFNKPENKSWFGTPKSSFFNILKELYIDYPISGWTGKAIPSEEYKKAASYMDTLTGWDKYIVRLGMAAPALTVGSFVAAGLSLYFFNKAQNIRKQIEIIDAQIQKK